MKIEQIKILAKLIAEIESGCLWFVATQTHPDFWFNFDPVKALQWYIDANWLIKTEHGTRYDPRKPL